MLKAGLAPVDASGTRIGAVFFPHVTLIQEFSGPGKVSGRVPVPVPDSRAAVRKPGAAHACAPEVL